MTPLSTAPSEPTWEQLDAVVRKHGLKSLSLMDTAALILKLSSETGVSRIAVLEEAAVEAETNYRCPDNDQEHLDDEDGAYNLGVKDCTDMIRAIKTAAPQDRHDSTIAATPLNVPAGAAPVDRNSCIDAALMMATTPVDNAALYTDQGAKLLVENTLRRDEELRSERFMAEQMEAGKHTIGVFKDGKLIAADAQVYKEPATAAPNGNAKLVSEFDVMEAGDMDAAIDKRIEKERRNV